MCRSTFVALCLLLLLSASGQSIAKIVHAGPDCSIRSIQGAIDAAADDDLIALEPGTYIQQHLRISNKTLRVFGNYPCSSDTQISGTGVATVIVGGGASATAVLTLSQFIDVQLADLEIHGGNARGPGVGGGITFNGRGTLRMTRTRIGSNTSDTDGGGIYLVANGGPADVWLFDGTLISGNYAAQKGGGIRISSGAFLARLYMVNPQTAITYNSATDGGGIYLDGVNARADIGSPGFHDVANLFYGAVSNNYAVHGGGGVAIADGANVRLFSTRQGEPVSITGNGGLASDGVTPTFVGGGILMLNAGGICGWGYAISGNKAGVGSAIYADGGGVNFFRHETLDICGPEPATDLHSVECAQGTACNHINDNRSAGGPTVQINSNAFLNMERAEMRRNTGGPLLENGSPTKLIGCVIAQNTVPNANFLVSGGEFVIDGCTIAGNTIQDFTDGSTGAAPAVVRAESNGGELFSLTRSILWNPSARHKELLVDGIEGALLEDVVSSDDSPNNVPGGVGLNVDVIDPQFIDFGNGDLHLGSTSPAIDDSSQGVQGELDMDGNPRGFDAAGRANGRRFDVGAYEFQAKAGN